MKRKKDIQTGIKKTIKCCICNRTQKVVDSSIKTYKCCECLIRKDPFFKRLMYEQKLRRKQEQKQKRLELKQKELENNLK